MAKNNFYFHVTDQFYRNFLELSDARRSFITELNRNFFFRIFFTTFVELNAEERHFFRLFVLGHREKSLQCSSYRPIL